MSWNNFLKTTLLAIAAISAVLTVFITLMNPYGNLPSLGLWPHAIMTTNQRYHYPAIVRTGGFDSAVFGTSSSRLLNPDQLGRGLGGSFTILSMDSATPWEQTQLANLFLKHTPNARTLIMAVDWVWCEKRAETQLITARGFPEWIFDDTTWNDWWFLFNGRMLETAVNQLSYRLGLKETRIPLNGYKVFVPPESEYDLARARQNIWHGREPKIPPQIAAYQPNEQERRSWRFPALPWLAELLKKRPKDTRAIVAFMPGHVTTQKPPGKPAAARIDECKAQTADIATAAGAHFFDFWIRSPITMEDSNYWDPLHYRVSVATRIVDAITIVVTGSSSQNADFIYRPPAVRQPSP